MGYKQKKDLIKKYIVIRTLRGTKRAIELAYGVLGVSVEIEEYPVVETPEGEERVPFKFALKITAQAISREFRQEIMRLTDLLKPLRTQYFIEVAVKINGKAFALPLLRVTNVARFSARIV